jgi:P-type conjugative transfer protein TrbJ
MKYSVFRAAVFRAAFAAAMLLGVNTAAHAQLTVFDPTNFAQNVVTAAKAVKGEIYQDTNIVYQYQMMANQLLQAVNLNPAAMKAQYDQITGDITQVKQYVSTLSDMYGDLQDGAQYIGHVQNLISTSGKSPTQWLSDMNQLYKQGDATATKLFQLGNTVATHVQTVAQRRADLQSQLSLTPTQEATAQLTTHYLDLVSSQFSDLLNLTAAKTQGDAQKQAIDNQDAKDRAAAAEAYSAQQDRERAALNAITVY